MYWKDLLCLVTHRISYTDFTFKIVLTRCIFATPARRLTFYRLSTEDGSCYACIFIELWWEFAWCVVLASLLLLQCLLPFFVIPRTFLHAALASFPRELPFISCVAVHESLRFKASSDQHKPIPSQWKDSLELAERLRKLASDPSPSEDAEPSLEMHGTPSVARDDESMT